MSPEPKQRFAILHVYDKWPILPEHIDATLQIEQEIGKLIQEKVASQYKGSVMRPSFTPILWHEEGNKIIITVGRPTFNP